MSKPDVLELHGTTMGGLSGLNVLQAAEEDFRRIERNEAKHAMAKRDGERNGVDYEHFAFHRDHVHKSGDAHDLIAMALTEQDKGTTSGKKNTRLIYKDQGTLLEALELAQKKYSK